MSSIIPRGYRISISGRQAVVPGPHGLELDARLPVTRRSMMCQNRAREATRSMALDGGTRGERRLAYETVKDFQKGGSTRIGRRASALTTCRLWASGHV
jgi:hypothetical protein